MAQQVIPANAQERIKSSYRSGKTLQQIGNEFGVSRERIRQLLRRWNVDADTGGKRIRAFKRAVNAHSQSASRRMERIKRWEEIFGCSYEIILDFCDGKSVGYAMQRRKDCRAGIYLSQRRNAALRGVGFELTIIEWWNLWQESGKWDVRGRGKGMYCMGRYGDTGPYAVGNVYICEFSQNIKDYYSCSANKAAWEQKRRDRRGCAK